MVTMTEVAKALNRQRQQEESYLHLNGGQAEDIQVGQIAVSGASLFPTYDKYKKEFPRSGLSRAAGELLLIPKKGGDLLSRGLGSTIGASGLNFSVRNGKRWDTGAIAT